MKYIFICVVPNNFVIKLDRTAKFLRYYNRKFNNVKNEGNFYFINKSLIDRYGKFRNRCCARHINISIKSKVLQDDRQSFLYYKWITFRNRAIRLIILLYQHDKEEISSRKYAVSLDFCSPRLSFYLIKVL